MAADVDVGEALCMAAYSADLDELRRLVRVDGADVNHGDANARTAMHLAAAVGSLDAVRILVELGANVSAIDAFGGRPLDDARRHKHHEIERFLLSLDALAGTCAFSGSAAAVAKLCEAASMGNAAELRRLVQQEHLAIDASNYDKRTALHVAASEGRLTAVMALVQELGARLSPVDASDATPLDEAIRAQHGAVAAYLRSHGAISLQNGQLNRLEPVAAGVVGAAGGGSVEGRDAPGGTHGPASGTDSGRVDGGGAAGKVASRGVMALQSDGDEARLLPRQGEPPRAPSAFHHGFRCP